MIASAVTSAAGQAACNTIVAFNQGVRWLCCKTKLMSTVHSAEQLDEFQACSCTGVLSRQLVVLQTLNNQVVTYAADLWALGCVLYQMLVGRPPFKAGTEYLTFQLIASGQVDMPASLPTHAQDLLHRLLLPDAGHRLGRASTRGVLPAHHVLGTSYIWHIICLAHQEFDDCVLGSLCGPVSEQCTWTLQILAQHMRPMWSARPGLDTFAPHAAHNICGWLSHVNLAPLLLGVSTCKMHAQADPSCLRNVFKCLSADVCILFCCRRGKPAGRHEAPLL